jgi:hypothetical protein
LKTFSLPPVPDSTQVERRPSSACLLLALEHGADEYAELCEELVRYRLACLAGVQVLAAYARQIAAHQRQTVRLVEENRRLRSDAADRVIAARAHHRQL